jgi:hypothetical protein
MFKKILKKLNTHLCYICNTKKKSALNSSTNIEPKELNLGVNSVKHFSAKSDSRFYLFVSPSVDQILS